MDNQQWLNRIVGEGAEAPDQLLANPFNARIHPQFQQDALLAVLDRVGWIQRVIVNRSTGNLLDGHLRVLLAMKRRERLVPVEYVELTEDEEKLVLATFDPITGLAAYDKEVLDALLKQVNTDSEYIQEMLANLATDNGLYLNGANGAVDPGAQVDKAAELQQKWQVVRGDLWRCGKHLLLCGDSTNAEDVARVMAGERADMVFTDPPYGVNYEGGRNPVSNVPRPKLSGDNSGALYYECLNVTSDFCKPTAPLYVWFADRGGKPVYDAVIACGYDIRALIIWNKLDAHYGNFMAQYMQKHEPCLYCVKEAPAWYGATNEVTVWDIKQPTVNEFHPTQKPVELATRALTNSSTHNDVVADWFCGSGTTLVACHQLGRQGRGIEISENYCAVILERMSGLGLEPERV